MKLKWMARWVRRDRIASLIENEVVRERKKMADQYVMELQNQRAQIEEQHHVELQIKDSQIQVLEKRIEAQRHHKLEVDLIYREAVKMVKQQKHITADIGHQVMQMMEHQAKTTQAFLAIQEAARTHEEDVLRDSHRSLAVLEKATF